MYIDMSRAMKLGLDKFLVMYCTHLENERKTWAEPPCGHLGRVPGLAGVGLQSSNEQL